MPQLTHLDSSGNARMVDVADKPVTARRAVATGTITLSDEAIVAITERTSKKGDVLAIAQLAGIQATKHTATLIPLCHPLPLTGVDVELEVEDN